jgi:hypothetical protein
MVSGLKAYIRLIEAFALLDAGVAGVVGSLVLGRVLEPSEVQPLALAAIAAVCLIFGTAVALVGEYARLRHDRRQYLSSAEFAELIHWSPRWINVTAALLFIYDLAVIIPLGEVSWRSGQPFARREALEICFFLSTFVSVSLPILASASRMPGTFAEQLD